MLPGSSSVLPLSKSTGHAPNSADSLNLSLSLAREKSAQSATSARSDGRPQKTVPAAALTDSSPPSRPRQSNTLSPAVAAFYQLPPVEARLQAKYADRQAAEEADGQLDEVLPTALEQEIRVLITKCAHYEQKRSTLQVRCFRVNLRTFSLIRPFSTPSSTRSNCGQTCWKGTKSRTRKLP